MNAKNILLGSLLTVALQAQAVLITFDNVTDYTSQFNEVDTQAASLTWSSSNGVGGVSGRINVPQGSLSDTTALYNVASFDLTAGATFTASLMFLIPTPIGGDAQITAAQVGFSEADNQGFLSGGGRDYITARVRANATGTTYVMEGQYANNGSATNVNTTGTFSLTAGNWYKISATFTKNASSFDYSALVEDFGTTGSSLVGSVQSISGNQAQTSLASSDTTAFAGFRANGHGSNNKVLALDNFAVVPEPGTLALVGVALGSLLLFRRRA